MVAQRSPASALVANKMPENFLVVDDHPLFLDAISLAIKVAFPDANIVEASSIEAANTAIAAENDFHLVLLDLAMPGTGGFDGLLEMRTRYPKLPILIVSGMEDPQIIHQAMNYGAAGFMTKSVRKDELAAAIELVMNGVVCLPRGYEAPDKNSDTNKDQEEMAEKLRTLTPQQLRVLKMLREGLLNKQIAYELKVGDSTVKAHVSEILRKLNVASRTQAVIAASGVAFKNVRDVEASGDDSQ